MKRFTMIVALAVMIALPGFAERVAPETARKVATHFLNNNGAKTNQLTDLTQAAGFPNLYIFTTEEGFVVMAADDRVKPILGYSFTDKFMTEEMPENISSWLQGYNNGIQVVVENQMSPTAEIEQLWEDLAAGKPNAAKTTAVVSALVSTKWNQTYPFNSYCPTCSSGGSNGHVYTGCVATAMAQIMKYWNYPSTGIGAHSYSWNSQTLSANFGSTTYNWSNMINSYNGSYSSVQRTAVATLMYHCGVSVDMYYGSGGSSASTYDVMNALQTYFNYAPSMQYKAKNSYTDSQWITMLKNELDASRPIQYRGSDAGGMGGHSFVCDGYDSSNNFHFNWGWGGYCDGYYSINDMEPGTGGAGAGNGVYTVDQEAIFGIRPSSNTSVPTNLTYTLTGAQNITLSWTGVSGVSSYYVYRNNNYIGSTTGTSFTETAPFGTNVYYVRSVINNELSMPSNAVSVTIAYQTPIVDDLSASLTDNNVSISWTAPDWCYPETPTATLSYGNGDTYYSWNNTYYAHRHLAANLAQYSNKAVYKVSTYVQYAGTYSVYVYVGTINNKPNQLVSSKLNVSVLNSNTWYDFDLNSPIILTGSDDLWIVFKQANTGQTYPTPSFNLSSYNANACYSGNSSPTNLNNISSNYCISWFIRAYLTDGTYTYNLYDGSATLASGISGTSYSVNNISNNAAHRYTVKTNYYGGLTNASNMNGFTLGTATLGSLNLGTNDKMTITANSKLTVNGTISNSNPANLVLEDGAQLVHNASGVMATVKKNITPYSDDDNGWHFITNPILNSIAPSTSNGLLNGASTSNTYDLYYYNEPDNYWNNYEQDIFSLNHAQGYLYANGESGGTTLIFEGELQPSGSSLTLSSLSYNAVDLTGFNLVGNPFACNASVNKDYYVIDDSNNEIVLAAAGRKIAPCEGVLVQLSDASDMVTFSRSTSKGEMSGESFDLVLSEGQSIIDRVRGRFGKGEGLQKTSLNENSDCLSIKQDGANYAVAYFENEKEASLNFHTNENGTYTISLETETAHLTYFHLIDLLTGKEIDLLAEPSYTFEAQTDDHPERFKLMFSVVE